MVLTVPTRGSRDRGTPPVALVRLAVALLLLAGCGGAAHARGAPSPGRWLSSSTTARQVTLTLVAGYNGTYGGFNFDGYGRGALLFRVPAGWRITVLCRNASDLLRHSCAVVRGANSTALAFPGASSPQPLSGLTPGGSARFSFRAARPGVYRLACLVPGHEDGGMWDVLEVARSGRPTALRLRG